MYAIFALIYSLSTGQPLNGGVAVHSTAAYPTIEECNSVMAGDDQRSLHGLVAVGPRLFGEEISVTGKCIEVGEDFTPTHAEDLEHLGDK